MEPATAATPGLPERTYTTVYDAGGLPVRDDLPGGVSIARTFSQRAALLTETGTGPDFGDGYPLVRVRLR